MARETETEYSAKWITIVQQRTK